MMKYYLLTLLLFTQLSGWAQPKTDCLCNGSTAGKGKFYAGLGPEVHLAFFENDNSKISLSTIGFLFHAGYNVNKKFSAQFSLQKYNIANLQLPEKNYNSVKFSYLDLSVQGVYRFVKKGRSSRFIPYAQAGYMLNSTLAKEYHTASDTTEENGFSPHGHYLQLGGGTFFILANQFTLFAETNLLFHPQSIFKGTYISDVFRMKPGFSLGINYHF